MNSPGNMPTSLGNYASCGCHIGPWWGVVPPPKCSLHEGHVYPTTVTTAGTAFQFAMPAPVLSEADVERIAKRAAELALEAMQKDKP